MVLLQTARILPAGTSSPASRGSARDGPRRLQVKVKGEVSGRVTGQQRACVLAKWLVALPEMLTCRREPREELQSAAEPRKPAWLEEALRS